MRPVPPIVSCSFGCIDLSLSPRLPSAKQLRWAAMLQQVCEWKRARFFVCKLEREKPTERPLFAYLNFPCVRVEFCADVFLCEYMCVPNSPTSLSNYPSATTNINTACLPYSLFISFSVQPLVLFRFDLSLLTSFSGQFLALRPLLLLSNALDWRNPLDNVFMDTWTIFLLSKSKQGKYNVSYSTHTKKLFTLNEV